MSVLVRSSETTHMIGEGSSKVLVRSKAVKYSSTPYKSPSKNTDQYPRELRLRFSLF